MTFSTLRAKSQVYLDHNATTPLAEVVAKQIPQWLELWGNPSSIHQSGRGPKTLIRDARDKIAKMLGAGPLELVFTSGGSESNNLALKGVFERARTHQDSEGVRNRYLIGAVEHPSVMRTAEYLREHGAEVEFIPVSREGEVDLSAFEAMLDERVALVSFMFANNETGNVFPIQRMVELTHAKGALFHSDCVQALGKVAINLRELGVDLASFSGHKFYALKGTGILFVRKGLSLESLVHGGGQERHRRGGTENVLAIASLGRMAEYANQIGLFSTQVKNLRNRLEARVLEEIPDVKLTGAKGERLPNTSSMVIPGVDGETLLMNLDMRGFAVSTGAACSSGSPEPSPVLLAMGLKREEAQSSMRIGLGWETTAEEVDQFVDTLKSVVQHLRSFNDLSERNSNVVCQ